MSVAWSVLDADERAQANRFRFASDRLTYVVAHGLLRVVLAEYTSEPAPALRFERSSLGRPELAGTLPGRGLRFNLSHSSGLVGCAITAGADLGFDIEAVRHPAPLEIADGYFSGAEVAAIRSPQCSPDEEFYRLWTLKEAYMKARGLGLALPLHSFAVEVDADGVGRLTLRPADDLGTWLLQAWRLPNHWVAFALGARDCPRFRVFLMRSVWSSELNEAV